MIMRLEGSLPQGKRLACPIEVGIVETEEGDYGRGWLACIQDPVVYNIGTTQEQAIEAFKLTLVETLIFLSEHECELSPALMQDLAKLRAMVVDDLSPIH